MKSIQLFNNKTNNNSNIKIDNLNNINLTDDNQKNDFSNSKSKKISSISP